MSMGYTTEQAKNVLPSYTEIEFRKMYKGNLVEDLFFLIKWATEISQPEKEKEIHPLHHIQKLTTNGSVFS